MEEIWPHVFRMLEVLMYALPVALVINILIIPALSPKARYWYKYIRRVLSPSEIRLEMVSKALREDKNGLPVDDMVKKLVSHLNANGCNARSNNDSILNMMDSIAIEISIYVKEVTEEEHTHLVSDGLELRFSSRCRFMKLDSGIIDLLGSKDRMKELLDGVNFKVSMDFSLICTLKGMALAKMLLDSAGTATMDYKTNNGHDFEIYNDRVVCHDNTMSSEIPSLIRKIIVTYS